MSGSVILVAGGAGGIGAETCLRMAEAEASIVVVDLDAAGAGNVAKRIVTSGGQAVGIACDITKPAECDAAAQAAVDHFGRLTGMVNCAGVSRPHDSLSLPPADWARMVDVQLNGAFYLAQSCARKMIPGGGAIVFITKH